MLLIVDLTKFGADDFIHSEFEAKVGDFDEDSDWCLFDYFSDSEKTNIFGKIVIIYVIFIMVVILLVIRVV